MTHIRNVVMDRHIVEHFLVQEWRLSLITGLAMLYHDSLHLWLPLLTLKRSLCITTLGLANENVFKLSSHAAVKKKNE